MAEAGKPRDRWDKADVIFKAISSVFLPLAIASLGYFGNDYLQKSQAREARNRLQTELMSKREESESGVRKDMFKTVIDSFLTPKTASITEKMLNLQLLTYNFYESFNLKPLFSHLDDELLHRKVAVRAAPPGQGRLRPCDDTSRASLERCRAILYELARYIAEKQRAMLEQVGKKFDMTLRLKALRDGASGGIPLNEATLFLVPDIQWGFRIEALAADVANKKIRIRLSVMALPRNREQQYDFWVEPFDFPIIDNIRLSNDERIAVVLTSFDNDQGLANMTALYFPGTYASLKEKPYLDEAILRLTRSGRGPKGTP